MRIAQIAPCWLTVPPDGYGGAEAVIGALTDGLVDRGHDVTLFAPGGSRVKANLVSYYDEPIGTEHRRANPLLELPQVLDAYARAAEFDVIHDHTFPLGPSLGAHLGRPPVIHTMHTAPCRPPGSSVYDLVAQRLHLVAVSAYQRRSRPDLPYTATVHNGIATEDFRFERSKQDYLLFMGRMSPGKGVHLAAEAAQRCGRRLTIAAKMRDPSEHEYFEREVAELLGDLVTFVGEVGPEQRRALYAGAACTLVPTQWAEAFGLVMVESLASGTPVVALRRGAAPEIVDDGITGFLADTFSDFVASIPRVRTLDPEACRHAAVSRFSADRMVRDYERIYEQVVR